MIADARKPSSLFIPPATITRSPNLVQACPDWLSLNETVLGFVSMKEHDRNFVTQSCADYEHGI